MSQTMLVDYVELTVAGVVERDDKSGTVQVQLGEGDTIARMSTVDGAGNTTVVYLDWNDVVGLMSAFGAAAHRM